MPALALSALEFTACSLVILVAGVALCRHGEAIAEATGLGATWVGILLLAVATSLPELVTGASSILVYDAPDVAVGDAAGSCMFNLVILALLDLRHPVPLSTRVHQGHVLAAAFGVVALGGAALALAAGPRAPSVGWVGLHSLAFIALYLVAMRPRMPGPRAWYLAATHLMMAWTARLRPLLGHCMTIGWIAMLGRNSLLVYVAHVFTEVRLLEYVWSAWPPAAVRTALPVLDLLALVALAAAVERDVAGAALRALSRGLRHAGRRPAWSAAALGVAVAIGGIRFAGRIEAGARWDPPLAEGSAVLALPIDAGEPSGDLLSTEPDATGPGFESGDAMTEEG